MRHFLCLLAVLVFVGVEGGFLLAARWQANRYASAVEENTRPRPQQNLSGQFIPSATTVLDNQPNPAHPSRIGWRVLVPFQTASETLLVDRGWHPAPADRTAFPPEISHLTSSAPISLTVTLHPFPAQKGWLKGPATAAHPRILARMSPAPIPVVVSTTHYAYEIAENTQLPPLRNPAMHRSYMLQWLGLAIAFPLWVGWHVIRRRRRLAQR